MLHFPHECIHYFKSELVSDWLKLNPLLVSVSAILSTTKADNICVLLLPGSKDLIRVLCWNRTQYISYENTQCRELSMLKAFVPSDEKVYINPPNLVFLTVLR